VVHWLGKPAFLGGQHRCIGQEFAVLEAVIAIATVVHSFRLTLPPGAVVGPGPVLTIRPRGGMNMTVEPL
jgi:enediyne biosynthesis protein E7